MQPNWLFFTQSLLNWFQAHKRDLPWRQTRDPYAVWISEVMLQQTQVKTALPYYKNFLKKFPNVESLAKAPLQEILKSWEGLGYYSRARHLHSTACVVRANYGGKLPGSREALLELPGIGPYTAGAIASIAFAEATPVVDGNVWRVFSRIRADSSSPNQGKKKAFEFFQDIIPESDPSSFNQALMELGSLVCTPKNPKCVACPVSHFCLAFKGKKVNRFPRSQVKKVVPHRNWLTLVVRHKNKVLLRQRPFRGIWGGLWECPTAIVKATSQLNKETKRLALSLDIQEQSRCKPLEPLAHTFSHFKLTLHPFVLHLKHEKKSPSCAWAEITDNAYPMPAPYLKILAGLGD